MIEAVPLKMKTTSEEKLSCSGNRRLLHYDERGAFSTIDCSALQIVYKLALD